MIELWREVPGDDSREARHYVREHSRRFVARTTSGRVTSVQVRSYRQCPKPFDPHPNDPQALVLHVTARRRRRANRVWDIEAVYTTELDRLEQPNNPLQRPAEISIEQVEYELPRVLDKDGQPLTNTAGDLLEGITEAEPGLVLHVQKNVAAWPRWLLSYMNAVNSDAVRLKGLTFPKGTLRLRGLRIPPIQQHERWVYYPLSFQLHFRGDGWQPRLLNRGWHELVDVPDPESDDPDATVKTKRRIRLANGEYPSEPQFLARDGSWLGEQPDPRRIVVLDHKTKRELPFAALPTR